MFQNQKQLELRNYIIQLNKYLYYTQKTIFNVDQLHTNLCILCIIHFQQLFFYQVSPICRFSLDVDFSTRFFIELLVSGRFSFILRYLMSIHLQKYKSFRPTILTVCDRQVCSTRIDPISRSLECLTDKQEYPINKQSKG